ncbi:MAG: hypothetical protein V2A56_09645 [bacterium]
MMAIEQIDVAFPALVGQDRIREILTRAVRQERLPHAYLFLGPEGSGKEAAALGLARALLCLSDHRRRRIEPVTVPCGVCDACVQTAKLANPALRILFPLPRPKESGEDESSSENYTDTQRKQIDDLLAAKSSDPYIPLQLPGGQEILIEHIRALRQEFRLTSFSGGWRVVLLSQADRLRVEAANAFLKLLEEPPDNVMFILTSSRESRLLATIVSRCQILRFPPLPESVLVQELKGRLEVDEAKALACARLADGSWRETVRWAREDPAGEMTKAVNLLRDLVRGDPGTLDQMTDTWAQASAGEFAEMLLLLSKWLRDVQRYGAAPDHYPELGKDPALVKFVSFTKERDLAAAIEEVDNARLDLLKNVQPALIAYHLFLRLWRTLFEKPASATV